MYYIFLNEVINSIQDVALLFISNIIWPRLYTLVTSLKFPPPPPPPPSSIGRFIIIELGIG